MPAIEREPWQIELKAHISAYDRSYADSQYHELASDADIEAFLEAEPLWDHTAKEWTAVANGTTLEDVRAHVRDIVDAIISKLGRKPVDGCVTRKAHSTAHSPLPHRERNLYVGGTSPAIVVTATGPSFEGSQQALEQQLLPLAFSSVATYIDVGQEADMTADEICNVLNSSIYAR